MKTLRIVIYFFLFPGICTAQDLKQTIKGDVSDADSDQPLPGATVVILNSNPLIGTATDSTGHFRIDSVRVGRYDIRISYIGYIPYVAREIVIGSGKEVVLNAGLKQSTGKLGEVTVNAYFNKGEPVNSMATLSARQVNMEEANRYAGGFDDPARLVSSYAGVASAVGNNGIVIQGNSPKGLLWRMEGVQISNPNHFADYISLGGGAVTALSSQTMASSDFFTGAFPAEYGNALSGVFDIKLRRGNPEKNEYVFQAGLIGIDFSAEGPFKKGKQSSYLFNYRYSTLGLLAPVLPKEMGKLTYQDLSFKMYFPIKAGAISLWGIGAYDYQGNNSTTDSTKWKTSDDREAFKTRLTMGAAGLSFKKITGPETYMHLTLAYTENSIGWTQKRYDDNLTLQPERNVGDYQWKVTLTGFLNHKFGARQTNRTGFTLDRLMYNINIKNADGYGDPLQTYVSATNASDLLQAYTESKITPTDRLTFNIGLHTQYFALNNKYSIEPRAGVSWNFLPRQTLSFAYGLHSQLERIQLYFVEKNTPDGMVMPNKNLDFDKARHFVFGYKIQFNNNLSLKLEPYYQRLFNIPVVPGSYVSTINLDNLWDFNDSLVNRGTGRNTGLDITLERYLGKGYYYLLTATLFDSKYKGGDGIERNTRYNRNYIFNVLGGKEWQVGANDNNLFNANVRFTYMGGERIIPLNIEETMAQEKITEDFSRAYQQKLPDAPILSLSISYRRNHPGFTGIWSFHIINALMHKDFQEYVFNPVKKKIEKKEDLLVIPNISYKVEF